MSKTWILAGALLVVASLAMEASAQGKGGGRGGMGMGMGRGEGMGMMKGTRVGLATQLGLSAEQQTQLEALKTTYEEKKTALRDEEQVAFKALLTAEQQAAIDAAATAGRGRHRGRGPALSLSTEQQTQLETLRTEFRAQHEAMHTEFQTAFEALLTAEQQTKLAELRVAGPFGMCTGAGAATGTTGTSSTSTLSAAKVVAAEDEPAAGDQAISWGQLKNADSE